LRPYRPLLTFEPESRIGRDGPFPPAELGLSLVVRQARVRIGEYVVDHVPISQLTPKAGTGVYLFDEAGRQCRVRRADLAQPAFSELWGYSGARLQLNQRDRLAIDVRSRLDQPQAVAHETNAPVWRPNAAPFGGAPCQMTNLHTHGLLVTPYKKDGLLGDYVLDLAKPSGATGDRCDDVAGLGHAHGAMLPVLKHRIDIPARPTDPGQSDALEDGKHPSGLFWVHPHPHGYSASQLSGGTTSLITVGSIGDYAAHLPAGAAAGQNMRFLMLKDAQIKLGPGGFVFRGTSDTGLCPQTPSGMGFWPHAECLGDQGFRWIFTINGVQKPRIGADDRPGEAELWRIANASPTVSYHLSLVPLAEVEGAAGPDGPLSRTPFFVLAKDGAGLLETGGGAAMEQELLLMPGARVEILVPPLDAKTYALVTEGVQTGGDSWPRVVLAMVEGKGAAAPAPAPNAPAAATAALAPMTSGPDINRATAAPSAAAAEPLKPLDQLRPCDRLAGRERLILFVKNPSFTSDDPTWGRGDLLGLIAGIRETGRRDPDQARFFERPTASTPIERMEPRALAEIRDWVKKPYNANEGLNFLPAFGHFPTLSDVCANFESDPAVYEDWVLENWSNEIHNFHIHQTRFTVAPHAVNDENYFDFPCDKPAYVTDPDKPDESKADKPCWLDQTNPGDPQIGFGDELIAQFYRGHLSTGFDSDVVRGSAHDSVPLPRGTTVCDGHVWDQKEIDAATDEKPACRPGRVTVRLRFNRRQQIGTFVYHCHILEHEDRGMMGVIEVRDPAAPSDLPATTPGSAAHHLH
jgi:FtsP/CotA-like multicopper oxidase with cupredoxin domain